MVVHRFTDQEKAFLVEFAPGHSRKEVTDAFNEKFGHEFELGRIVSAMKRYGAKTGRDGRFVKGQISHNKGQKMSPEQYEKCKATMFKKNQVPHNYMPVGSERINSMGYRDVKIEEPNVWRGKHILIWEEAYGKIPTGYVINFLDGDPLNVELSNLVCVSREEHSYLNIKGLRFKETELNEAAVNMVKVMSKIHERMVDKNEV